MPTAAPVALRRNRDFVFLQAGQLLSEVGTQTTSIAYPLLVLALTGSAAQAGVVSFARAVPVTLFALLTGAAADRWNRKRLMVAADAVRAVAIGALAASVLLDRLAFWVIPAVAFVEGAAATLFGAAHAGALRAVVPVRQLPAAAGVQTGRDAAVRLTGPPLGGFLFGLAQALPFIVDAISYACSIGAVLAIRKPFQQHREPDRAPLRTRLAEGFRYLWTHPFLRTCALLFGLTNFVGAGVLFTLVVVAKRQHLPGGQVGALVAAFGLCLLLGSFVAPFVRRVLPVRTVLVLELWTWPGCAAFLLWPHPYVLAAAILPSALVIPSTDSVVHGYRIALTPDRLLGRVESVRSTISLLLAPLAPLAAGILLDAASPRVTVAVFAAAGLTLAVWGTLSPAIRTAPGPLELSDEG